jgi:predicted alpha/beta-fold hydrolase
MVMVSKQVRTMPEFQFPQYDPPAWLKNGHLMTIVPTLMHRNFAPAIVQAQARQFEVEPGNQLLARCTWQQNKTGRPTILIVHGLEGSSEARYVLAVAHKAFALGMNVVRLNLRNCGETLHLSTTLYHAGMSADLIEIARQLKDSDGLESFALMGFSLGGNIVLKAVAELSLDRENNPGVEAVAAISPSLDLLECVRAIQKPENWMYEHFFVSSLRRKIRQKAQLCPGKFDVALLNKVTGILEFDDMFTAVHGGFGSAENYYATQSALQLIDKIDIPTLLITAQDDPLVPFAIFDNPAFCNPHITLLAPKHGGHAGFLASKCEDATVFDRHWAENRAAQFCAEICRVMDSSRLESVQADSV